MLKKSERLTEFFVKLTKSKSQADSFLTLNKNYVVKQSLFLRCTNICFKKEKAEEFFSHVRKTACLAYTNVLRCKQKPNKSIYFPANA